MRLFIHGDYAAAGDGELAGAADQRHRHRPRASRGRRPSRPVRWSITAPAPPPAIRRRRKTRPSTTKEVAALRAKAQATPIEYRLYYADYRDVDGVKLPFRLRRAIGTGHHRRNDVRSLPLNTKIDPRKFTVPQR